MQLGTDQESSITIVVENNRKGRNRHRTSLNKKTDQERKRMRADSRPPRSNFDGAING